MKEWAKAFYESLQWKYCRNAFLASKNFLCERCLSAGKYIPADIVHHKQYLTRQNISNPDITLSWQNLEALCQDCHNKEHSCKNKLSKRYAVNGDGSISPLSGNAGRGSENRKGDIKKTL